MKEKTMKELRDTAKELGIAGRWDMTKEQLIKAIQENPVDPQEVVQEQETESDIVEEQEWEAEEESEVTSEEEKSKKPAKKLKKNTAMQRAFGKALDGANAEGRKNLEELILESEVVEEGASEVKWKSQENSGYDKDAIKAKYIESAEEGTIVAVLVDVFGNERVKSAAIKEVDLERKTIVVETKVGVVYNNVPYKHVLWIKSGNKWPKSIYQLLKGELTFEEYKRNEK